MNVRCPESTHPLLVGRLLDPGIGQAPNFLQQIRVDPVHRVNQDGGRDVADRDVLHGLVQLTEDRFGFGLRGHDAQRVAVAKSFQALALVETPVADIPQEALVSTHEKRELALVYRDFNLAHASHELFDLQAPAPAHDSYGELCLVRVVFCDIAVQMSVCIFGESTRRNILRVQSHPWCNPPDPRVLGSSHRPLCGHL